MNVYRLSRHIAKLANLSAAFSEATVPEAQAHIRLAADALLKAKSHLQTASRLEEAAKKGIAA